ncbi:hypothetical protein ACLEVL_25040, partial [Enterobacter ludwigii]
MGVWDKIRDLFRPDKKAAALRELWETMYPVNHDVAASGDQVIDAVTTFNRSVAAFERLAAMCDDVGNRTVGKKVRRTTVET